MLKTERISILLGAIAGVAACAQVEIGAHAVKSSAAANDPGDERLAPVQVASDAEGYALWSGFRTSNGVWVAHPRLPAPSRAYVRNSVNGRVIEAKVMRRDPSTPGPMILLSAEAARELEIGPHRLTKVQIEVIEDALPDAAVAEAPTAEVPEPAPAGEVSESALTPVEGVPEPLAAIVEAPETPAPAPDPGALPAGGDTAPPPQVLAEIPAEPTAVAAQQSPSAPTQPTPAPESGGVFRGDAPYQLGDTHGGGEMNLSEPATPSAPEAITAAEAPAPAPVEPAPVKVASAPVAAEPSVRTAAAPSPVPAPTPSPSAATDEAQAGQRFVQVVSFSAESSAAELATRLNALGHPALTDSSLTGETRWHRVLIGPLANEAEASAALEAASSLGYKDAYVTLRPAGAPDAQPPAAPARAEPVAAASAPAPSTAAAAPAASSGARPYVQVGSFKVQDNADAVVTRLKDLGLPAYATSGSGGSNLHRVLIGPLDGSEKTARALEAARSLGHSDAYVTRF